MFIGHFAAGFAAKRFAPRTPLPLLLFAALLADVLWPVLLLAGVEHAAIMPDPNPNLVLRLDDYPWSHSLLLDLVWAAVLGWVASRWGGRRAALVTAAAVLSHWVLDAVSHTPDMPLWPGGPEVGLALWRSRAGTIAVECALFAAGVALYLRATRARGLAGRVSLWSLVLLLLIAYFMPAPPPPSLAVVAVVNLVMVAVTLAWAAWLEHTRAPVVSA